jgi:hypothetical protein
MLRVSRRVANYLETCSQRKKVCASYCDAYPSGCPCANVFGAPCTSLIVAIENVNNTNQLLPFINLETRSARSII